MSAFLSFLQLNLAVLFSLFLPGWIILSLFFKKENFSWLANLVLSAGLSLFFANFFFIFLDRWGMAFSQSWKIFVALNVVLLIFHFLIQKRKSEKVVQRIQKISPSNWDKIFWIILLMAVIFRVFYLAEKVIPSSTDLGHHMYWSKSILESDRLPNYGMPDFIIGEHIVFALVSGLSQWDLISALPMSLLFIFNLLSLLAFFLLARQTASWEKENHAEPLALLALLIGGVFYSFSSPQATFVSGGVIGNILGNFFIPLILFCLLKAFRGKSPAAAVLAVGLSAALVYTHHLSSYILLFVLLFFFAFLILNDLLVFLFPKKSGGNFLLFSAAFGKTFFSPKVLAAIALFVGFIFLVQPPSYLNKAAIDVAVGEPSKETRTGYDWPALQQTLGDWRALTGLIGTGVILIFLIFLLSPFLSQKLNWAKTLPRKSFFVFSGLLILAWAVSIFLMSWAPQWLKTDIPSRRIVSYLTWPASLLAAGGLFFFFQLINRFFSQKSAFLFFFILLAAGFFSSNQEGKPYFLSETDNSEAYQTFAAAQYLALASRPEEKILKDHIYLKGDTWVKLFLMRGYNEPLSRTNLSRYDDPVKPRETCTRDIVANPDNPVGKKCLEETGVKYVLLRKDRDDQNFKKSSAWSKIFSSQKAVIFYHNSNE